MHNFGFLFIFLSIRIFLYLYCNREIKKLMMMPNLVPYFNYETIVRTWNTYFFETLLVAQYRCLLRKSYFVKELGSSWGCGNIGLYIIFLEKISQIPSIFRLKVDKWKLAELPHGEKTQINSQLLISNLGLITYARYTMLLMNVRAAQHPIASSRRVNRLQWSNFHRAEHKILL